MKLRPVLNLPHLTEDPTVNEIAQKLNATAAQVLIAWGAQNGVSVIPKSVKEGMSCSSRSDIYLADWN